MNKIYKSLAIAIVGLLSFNSTAQEMKKELKKEVKMTETNGEKELTITTSENGTITEEKYQGEAAEQKLKETQNEATTNKVTEEVKLEEINGEKVLTIKKSENGNETIEVLKGEAADARLKEMEANQTKPMKKTMKKVEVRKVEMKEKE